MMRRIVEYAINHARLTLATLATLLVVPALYALALPWRRAGALAGPAVLAPAE